MRPTSRWIAWIAASGSGCESCDFSFGQIPVTVTVSPTDVVATVTVCEDPGEGQESCQTLTTAPPPSTPYGTTAEVGTVSTSVSWDGYMTCRYPDVQIRASAPGCEPAEVFVEGGNPPGEFEPIDVTLSLRCG